jgi:hypothetical protein
MIGEFIENGCANIGNNRQINKQATRFFFKKPSKNRIFTYYLRPKNGKNSHFGTIIQDFGTIIQ